MATYFGQKNFDDRIEPVPDKNEWGVDTLRRELMGAQDLLPSFLEGLLQGSAYSALGKLWYLQTWSSDGKGPYATVFLYYKGFTGTGTYPNPVRSYTKTLAMVEVGVNLTIPFKIQGKITAQYLADTVRVRYLKNNNERVPSYLSTNLDDPSVVDYGYTPNDPNDPFVEIPPSLIEQIMVASNKLQSMNCEQIHGTPYYECEEIIAKKVRG